MWGVVRLGGRPDEQIASRLFALIGLFSDLGIIPDTSPQERVDG